MKKLKLNNGLTTVMEKTPTETVTVQVTVKVGSNNETKKINGISHFIEHMVFEGTKKRPDSRIISNEIESLGGELNAYTTNDRTSYYVKVPKRHFDKALDIISDIILNPVFDEKKVDKERKIILKEINLHKDQPRTYQWVLFSKTLFRRHSAKLPTYGTVKAVTNLTRKDLLSFYHKYYTLNNIILSVAGNFGKRAQCKIKLYFKGSEQKKLPPAKKINEPKQDKIRIKKEKKKVLSSYIVLGYKTPPRTHRDSYVLDVIKSILGRGQSGKIFDEIRAKRGLAYEVGVHHESCKDYSFFAVFLSTHKKYIKTVVGLILKEFDNLKAITNKDIKEAKGYIIGQHIMENEDTRHMADELGYWESVGDARLLNCYIAEINKVKKEDIIRVARKYLTKNYALSVIEQS